MAVIDGTIALQQIPYIFGKDARDLKDNEIYEYIKTIQYKIKSLNEVENKPKKLLAEVKRLQSEIDELVKFVDGRE